MFVVRGRDGQILTSTAWDETNDQEIQHETYEQAEQALQELELSMPKGLFRIEAIKCERCGGSDDVAIIHVNDEPKAYCQNCRVEMFTRKKPVGRPSLGVTKKVSLTLSEDNWDWLDEQAEGNRSNFIREAVWNALGNESEWSNQACLGYAIAGAKKLGYDDEKIHELVRVIYGEFDMKSVPEAEEIYRDSDY
jgi:hypothetical protein